MPQYDNNNSGALFKNDRKTEDKHPDYNGSAEIDGVQYWVNAWIKTVKKGDKAGSKFMSLSFKPKDENAGQRRGSAPAEPEPRDEDLPF